MTAWVGWYICFVIPNKCIWSLSPAQGDVNCATLDLVAQCGACRTPILDLIMTQTRLQRRLYSTWQLERVDLFLPTSQTKCIWSLSLAQGDVNCATLDLVAQCGADRGPPQLDLIMTQTKLQCCLYSRWQLEWVGIVVLLFQTKCIWSLSPAQGDVNCATLDLVAQCAGACRTPILDLIITQTRLQRCLYSTWQLEWVGIFVLLSQTKCIWFLSPAQGNVNCASTIDLVAQCGAGGSPILDLIMTQTRLQRRLYSTWQLEWVGIFVLLSQTKYIWSLAPAQGDVYCAKP